MSAKTTRDTLMAYFQSLVDANAKYIDPGDLETGLEYSVFDTPNGNESPSRRIQGMTTVHFRGHTFVCPDALRRHQKKKGAAAQPR